MKIVMLLLLTISCGTDCTKKIKITKVGNCTKQTFLNSSKCRTILSDGSRQTIYAPIMIGDEIYVDPICGVKAN